MNSTGLECPVCYRQGHYCRLSLKNPQRAGVGTKVSRGTCPRCHKTFVVTQVVVREVTDKGTGAHAVAKRLAQGRAKLQLHDPEAPDSVESELEREGLVRAARARKKPTRP